MASEVVGLVPVEHARDHLLAVPRTPGTARVPLEVLAAGWFPASAWERPPGGEPEVRPMAGARFRGMVSDDVALPGILRLTEGVTVVGPFPLTAPQTQALDLASATAEIYAVTLDEPRDRSGPVQPVDDRDGLGRVFADGWPSETELGVVRWMIAAARRAGGAVVIDGRTHLTPDPSASVDLTLFSAQALDPQSALGVLRTVIATSQITGVEERPDGPSDYLVTGESSYDGALEMLVQRVQVVPQSLAALEWREYGPFAYRLSWRPSDPYELEAEHPSGVHVIARTRMRASVARLAAMLQGRIGGTLVDEGGFVVGAHDLEERLHPTSAPPSSRFRV
ncbi:hypothetical protein [Oerskovia flava]|uniref:hypothetical protein n=1 Tax=Oerskovia flava TaxID=2986422 RepID=UPI00224077BE|nr:hypothetical protein [Oerskovia sp. JB1-3-2]